MTRHDLDELELVFKEIEAVFDKIKLFDAAYHLEERWQTTSTGSSSSGDSLKRPS